MLVLIDNYDSFTYNLFHALAAMGEELRVFRNDQTTPEQLSALQPDAIVISPGPCTPKEAGISMAVVKIFSGRIPILGVCLGHQAIGAAFGAEICNARAIMHGKTSLVRHVGTGLYHGISNPFPAGRYHSLAVKRETLPPVLKVEAETEDGEIMGMRHVVHDTYGVQFHPESILTPSGKRLLRNFIEIKNKAKK